MLKSGENRALDETGGNESAPKLKTYRETKEFSFYEA